ncbi:MAG: hypothetical protein EAZ07_08755 [Cytophagales bacterium]|nr:MAG: hypothetical protein EAZ07_08755 [Cytophagales bacterium]
MPRFRTLTLDELKNLEKEFIQFLIVQGISADHWEKIKINAPQDSILLIDNFSDFVFESVFSKELYIELRHKNMLQVFHAQLNEMSEVCLQDLNPEANFFDDNWLNQITKPTENTLEKYTRTISYQNRALELFIITEQGGKIVNHELFDFLKSL